MRAMNYEEGIKYYKIAISKGNLNAQKNLDNYYQFIEENKNKY
jgi:TPR repeat protein